MKRIFIVLSILCALTFTHFIGAKMIMQGLIKNVEEVPLCIAVLTNNIPAVDRLLAEGNNPNETTILGHTPLIQAAREGKLF